MFQAGQSTLNSVSGQAGFLRETSPHTNDFPFNPDMLETTVAGAVCDKQAGRIGTKVN
jgi:hypothetical protein